MNIRAKQTLPIDPSAWRGVRCDAWLGQKRVLTISGNDGRYILLAERPNDRKEIAKANNDLAEIEAPHGNNRVALLFCPNVRVSESGASNQ